jgi:hypothetical protein
MADGTSRRPWLKAAQVRKLTGLSGRQVARIFPEMAAWGAKRLDGCHWALPDTREARRALTVYKRRRAAAYNYAMSGSSKNAYYAAENALFRFIKAIRRCRFIKDGQNPYALNLGVEVERAFAEYEKKFDSINDS